MPLWRIFHPPATFTDAAEKKALSEAITKVYTAVPLPAFYVVVTFIPLPADSIFVGGEPQPSSSKPNFIRVVASNIARRMPEGPNEHKTNFLDRVEAALKPFIADKGWDWEFHTEETDRFLWRIQGMNPPLPETDEERMWIKENRPVEYEGAYTKS